eukprot:5628746-Amphidinium_carterae.1
MPLLGEGWKMLLQGITSSSSTMQTFLLHPRAHASHLREPDSQAFQWFAPDIGVEYTGELVGGRQHIAEELVVQTGPRWEKRCGGGRGLVRCMEQFLFRALARGWGCSASGTNLVDSALRGRLDPVIGRDQDLMARPTRTSMGMLWFVRA